MWVIVHTLSGAALGAMVPLPTWALVPLALLLHLGLDVVPHWDYTGVRRWAVWAYLDVAASILALLALALAGAPLAVLLSAVVSAIPDLDLLDLFSPGWGRRRWFPSHWPRFPHGRCGPAWGVAIMVVVMLTSLAALLWM